MPAPAGRGGNTRHQRRHRLSHERLGGGSAHAAARAAGWDRHSIRHLYRQDAGAGERGGGGAIAAKRLPGGLPRPARESASRRHRGDDLSCGGSLLPGGHAHGRPAAAHSAHQRQAIGVAAHPAAGHRTIRRRPPGLSGVRRGPHLHRRPRGGNRLPHPPLAGVLPSCPRARASAAGSRCQPAE